MNFTLKKYPKSSPKYIKKVSKINGKNDSEKSIKQMLKRVKNNPPNGAQIDPKIMQNVLRGYLVQISSPLGSILGPLARVGSDLASFLSNLWSKFYQF